MLPESVTMSTSSSTDAAADDAGVNQTPELQAAFRKLRQNGFNTANLSPVDSVLWGDIRAQYNLSNQEAAALQNHACRPRPRGVLPSIESGTIYRVSDERVRAKFTISNVKGAHRYVMEAELLVDSGANTELRLPACKVRQLCLEIRGSLRCRGSTNDVYTVLIFSPVLVKATFIRDGVHETIQADLAVKCDKHEYDALGNFQPGPGENGGGETFATPPTHQPTKASPIAGATPDNSDEASRITVVHLSPTKHRTHNAPLQQAVIGIDGMKKLCLHLNSDLQQLEIEEDEVLDEY
jgi:hypothetical protein